MVFLTPLFAFTAFIAPASVAALWPVPRSLSTGSTPLRLASGFKIALDIKNPPSDLNDAVTRSKKLLASDKLEMLVVGRGANNTAAVKGAKQLGTLTLSLEGNAKVNSISEEAIVDITQRSEGYTLNIPADGSEAKLTANSYVAYHALELLLTFVAVLSGFYEDLRHLDSYGMNLMA